MSYKGGFKSAGSRGYNSKGSGGGSHKSKGSHDKSCGDKSKGSKCCEESSHHCCKDKSSGNHCCKDKSSGNKSSGSSNHIPSILSRIGVGTPNIRIHYNGVAPVGVFLGIVDDSAILNVRGVVIYIKITVIVAVEVGVIVRRRHKNKYKCRKVY